MGKGNKIYFILDAHLGARFHRDPRAIENKLLVRWLDSIKGMQLHFICWGDMFDYWYEYKYVVPKGHVRFLGKVGRTFRQRGIEIHFFIGNHDIWMFDYEKEIGAIIQPGLLTVDLLEKRFFPLLTGTRWTTEAWLSVLSGACSETNSVSGYMRGIHRDGVLGLWWVVP